MKRFNELFAGICLLFCLLIALYSLVVGVIGFIFADEHYVYGAGCGLNLICTISHVYYSTHPFLVGIFGLLGAAIVLWLALKVDAKLEQQSSAT